MEWIKESLENKISDLVGKIEQSERKIEKLFLEEVNTTTYKNLNSLIAESLVSAGYYHRLITLFEFYAECFPDIEGLPESISDIETNFQAYTKRLVEVIKKDKSLPIKEIREKLQKSIDNQISTSEILDSLESGEGLDSLSYDALFSACIQISETRGMLKIFSLAFGEKDLGKYKKLDLDLIASLDRFKEDLKGYRGG